MKKIISTLFLLSMLITPMTGQAQKIGVANLNALFNEYGKEKGLDKLAEEKFGGANKDLEKKVIEIKAFEKEIKTNELMMTESKLNSSKNKLKAMYIEYKQQATALDKGLKELRNEEMLEFRKVLSKVVSKYAADKKYDIILNEGVVFAVDSVNITKDLAELLSKASK